jgi:hypothetical protein
MSAEHTASDLQAPGKTSDRRIGGSAEVDGGGLAVESQLVLSSAKAPTRPAGAAAFVGSKSGGGSVDRNFFQKFGNLGSRNSCYMAVHHHPRSAGDFSVDFARHPADANRVSVSPFAISASPFSIRDARLGKRPPRTPLPAPVCANGSPYSRTGAPSRWTGSPVAAPGSRSAAPAALPASRASRLAFPRPLFPSGAPRPPFAPPVFTFLNPKP